jgi:hypothetical protein
MKRLCCFQPLILNFVKNKLFLQKFEIFGLNFFFKNSKIMGIFAKIFAEMEMFHYFRENLKSKKAFSFQPYVTLPLTVVSALNIQYCKFAVNYSIILGR